MERSDRADPVSYTHLTVERVFARAEELLALGLSVPQVTKIFLKLREMGLDLPTDVYTVDVYKRQMRASPR